MKPPQSGCLASLASLAGFIQEANSAKPLFRCICIVKISDDGHWTLCNASCSLRLTQLQVYNCVHVTGEVADRVQKGTGRLGRGGCIHGVLLLRVHLLGYHRGDRNADRYRDQPRLQAALHEVNFYYDMFKHMCTLAKPRGNRYNIKLTTSQINGNEDRLLSCIVYCDLYGYQIIFHVLFLAGHLDLKDVCRLKP